MFFLIEVYIDMIFLDSFGVLKQLVDLEHLYQVDAWVDLGFSVHGQRAGGVGKPQHPNSTKPKTLNPTS